ncbi:MAG: peptidase T [Lachnospiraceae bacterium]|nr:peptidase T [Lachnospiraceae bacterium]
MRAYERLMKYVQVWTTSDDDNSCVTPSTARQFDLANMLDEEMKELGISNVRVDGHAYVYGEIPATKGCEDRPAVGFLAHMDTAPDFNGENVRPKLHENYQGGDITLGSGRIIEAAKFPDLAEMIGHTVMTADGTSLLGADDKAGIAEILTAAERILREGLPHGKICIAFVPDEEIGHGASLLDIDAFGADFAYTLDGGAPNEVVYETFNASHAHLDFIGFNIHPGEAKDRMKNAALIAAEFAGLLPADEIPAKTEGYQGFFHLTDMRGDVESATLDYIIRDHSAERFAMREEQMREAADEINRRYGEVCRLTVTEQYRNMYEVVKDHMEVVRYAEDAVRAQGMTVDNSPIRGGTDGSQLSYRGLICPNIGTGGFAFHGPYEHISVQYMDIMVEVVLDIIGNICR